MVIALLSACSGKEKKVLVMSSGDMQISGNTINLKPGTRHHEETFKPEGDSITVVSPAGTKGFSVKDAGYYVLNLKNDTIAGAYQRVGTDNSQIVISRENLKTRIDSLVQLMKGTNVSAAAKNYNLPPNTIAKITDNVNAEIIGPYLSMPRSFDPSTQHEVYKFYTNRELMEIVEKSGQIK